MTPPRRNRLPSRSTIRVPTASSPPAQRLWPLLRRRARQRQAWRPSASQHSNLEDINLNTATAAQLVQLPGIGPSYAERIIAYRTEHGSFKTVDELENVKGIGKKRLEQIRPFVRVGRRRERQGIGERASGERRTQRTQRITEGHREERKECDMEKRHETDYLKNRTMFQTLTGL